MMGHKFKAGEIVEFTRDFTIKNYMVGTTHKLRTPDWSLTDIPKGTVATVCCPATEINDMYHHWVKVEHLLFVIDGELIDRVLIYETEVKRISPLEQLAKVVDGDR
jgi:hypothetical protein